MTKHIVIQENTDFYLVYPYQCKDEPKFTPHIQNDHLFFLSKTETYEGNLIRYSEIGVCRNISEFDMDNYIKKHKIKKQYLSGGNGFYTVNSNDLVFCLDYKELNQDRLKYFYSLPKN